MIPEDDIDTKFKDKSAKEFSEAIKTGDLYEELKPKDGNNEETETKQKKIN